MFSDTWLVISTFCCIAWMSWVFISNRRRVDPPLPPGPSGLPVVGNLPFLDPNLHSYFAGLAKNYGPLVSLRLGRKIVMVASSPSTAKEILKDNDIIFANHDVAVAAQAAANGGVDIALSPYGPEWRMLRKVWARMVSSATLDAVYGLRKHEIHQTMLYLKEQSGSVVNVGDQIFVMTMNMVTNMLWGGTVRGEERAKLGADLLRVVTEITDLLAAPNVSDFFPALERFDLQGIVKRMKACAERLDGLFEDLIDRCRKMDNHDQVEVRKDFLQVLLEWKDSGSGEDPKTPFTMVHLKALLSDMLIGATDAASHTLEFAMAEIVNSPQVMRRAQQELDTLLGSSNGPLEESHIPHLPYLQAIMKESLRLHPTLPLLVPHCPSESCIVGGYTIPKGSRVFVNVWAIQRDPSLWEDPLDFKPERFLEGRNDASENDFSYFPWSSGRRICAGTAISQRMVLYSLASLLRYFDWKLPEGVEKVDLDEKFGIALKKRTPLLLIPSPRSSYLG